VSNRRNTPAPATKTPHIAGCLQRIYVNRQQPWHSEVTSALFQTFVTPAQNDDRIFLHASWNRLYGGSWDFKNEYSSQEVVHCCSAIELRLLVL